MIAQKFLIKNNNKKKKNKRKWQPTYKILDCYSYFLYLFCKSIFYFLNLVYLLERQGDVLIIEQNEKEKKKK